MKCQLSSSVLKGIVTDFSVEFESIITALIILLSDGIERDWMRIIRRPGVDPKEIWLMKKVAWVTVSGTKNV